MGKLKLSALDGFHGRLIEHQQVSGDLRGFALLGNPALVDLAQFCTPVQANDQRVSSKQEFLEQYVMVNATANTPGDHLRLGLLFRV
jgi:hypothetical protein